MNAQKKSKLHVIFIAGLSIILLSCQSVNTVPTTSTTSAETNLKQFAHANCFFWYFKKMGYDTKDIRSISGGIVELGSSSADKYQQISLFVKDYKPDIKTKNDIDIDLLKCFKLDESVELNQLINSLK